MMREYVKPSIEEITLLKEDILSNSLSIGGEGVEPYTGDDLPTVQ